MRSRYLGFLLALVVALVAGGLTQASSAQRASAVGARIKVTSAQAEGTIMRVKGKSDSRIAACRANRTIKLGLRTTAKLWPTDKARTGDRGGWRLRMDLDDLPADDPGFGKFRWLEVSMPRTVVRSGGRRIVCAAEKVRAVYTRLLITSVRGTEQTGGAAIVDGWVYTWLSACSGRTISVRNLTDGANLGSPTPDNPDWSAGTGWTLTPPGTANAGSDKYRATAPGKTVKVGDKVVQCVKGYGPYPS